MVLHSLILTAKSEKAYNIGYQIGNFIGENIFLLAGLLIGLITLIIMRKTLKTKP